MIKITTKAYGEVELDNKAIFYLPNGLLGFETLKQWAMFPANEQPFYILQSLEELDVAFFLINPLLFRADYQATPPTSDLATLKLQELTPTNSLALAIVNITGEGLENISFNLQAPVVFNKNDQIALQTISTNPLWQLRHNLQEEVNRLHQC